ncbi:MAG: hypothetical protein ACYDDD_04595 [Acidithiobacillus ferrivorans]
MKYLPFVCLHVFRKYTAYNFSRVKKWYPHLNRERSMMACGRGLFSYCYQVTGYTFTALCPQKEVAPMHLMLEDVARTAGCVSFLAQAEEKKTTPAMMEIRTNVEYFNDANSMIMVLCSMRSFHANAMRSTYPSWWCQVFGKKLTLLKMCIVKLAKSESMMLDGALMSLAEAVIRFFQNTASDYSAGQAVGLPSLGSGMQDYTVLVLRPAMTQPGSALVIRLWGCQAIRRDHLFGRGLF